MAHAGLLLHFVPDSWEPHAILARYRERLAPGSFLPLSHVAADANSSGLEPGVVGCAMWNPQGAGDMSEDPEINSLPYAGVGRKP
ncbi:MULTISPECIES: SAM-dependent methyltransferase [unclassified Amycolatopsis]|uniref:SAM-dependent methyltransferase n=1 Tax=unclassified Amycolatopsis TaxID=2618356 RepID=UPI001F2479D7|nr:MULTISPECIES: SAM-dependent methyltransferase [unclassified Amycolatopsis]